MKRKTTNPFVCILSILILLLAGIFLILFLHIKRNGDYNRLLSLGDKYLQELNYEDAAIAFQNAIEISEKDPAAYLRLADVYTASGDYDQAADILLTGYDAADDNTLIRSRMAAVYSLVSPSLQEQIRQKIPNDVPGEPSPAVTAEASPSPTQTPEPAPSSTPVPTEAPPEETESDGSFTSQQLDTIREMLRVPDTPEVTVTQDAPSYWDAGQRWLVQVTFYNSDGEMIAGAAFDEQTMEMCRNIYMYSGG